MKYVRTKNIWLVVVGIEIAILVNLLIGPLSNHEAIGILLGSVLTALGTHIFAERK